MQACQALQAHIQNCPRLQIAQLKGIHQADAGFVRTLGGADKGDNLAIVRHGKHIDAEARFQRRVFIENIGYNVGNCAAFEIHDNADTLAVGFVAQIGNAVNLALIDQRAYFFDKR